MDRAVSGRPLSSVGVDGVALKPAECDLRGATALDVETVVVDFEGRGHVPDTATLVALAEAVDLRVTVPVRADGFDLLGDDARLAALPDAAGVVLVAGHSDYLREDEAARAAAPRLRASAAAATDPWIGTEGVERLALAVGGTQFEILSPTTARDVRALREAGFDGDVAVYAPIVLSTDPGAVLDAVGEYVARRPDVVGRLSDGTPTDARAAGPARGILRKAATGYALVGDAVAVSERVATLRDAGVDHVVVHPAAGLDPPPD